MTPVRVAWRRQAEVDLTRIYLSIAEDSPAAAERWLDAVEDTVQLLRLHPQAGRLRRFRSSRALGVRSRPLARFRSYLVFYRVDGAGLDIIRILHGARDVPEQFGGGS